MLYKNYSIIIKKSPCPGYWVAYVYDKKKYLYTIASGKSPKKALVKAKEEIDIYNK